MNTLPISYKRHRFPSEIIAHAAWFYCRFNMNLREVEELLLERIITPLVTLPYLRTNVDAGINVTTPTTPLKTRLPATRVISGSGPVMC